MIDIQSLPYRPCVGIALFNAQNQIFVGERIDNPGSWQMPQGGVDEGEDIETALWRELAEEVGLKRDHAVLEKIADEKLRYDLPLERIPGFWNGRFRGQEQTWCKLRFTGADSDIILDAYAEPEFLQWKWASREEALEKIVPFKRDLYARVFEVL